MRERRNISLTFLVSRAEKAAFKRAAEVAGCANVEDWMRQRLRAAVYREMDVIGEPAFRLAGKISGEGK